jgi:hypothetical protein
VGCGAAIAVPAALGTGAGFGVEAWMLFASAMQAFCCGEAAGSFMQSASLVSESCACAIVAIPAMQAASVDFSVLASIIFSSRQLELLVR